MYNNKLVSYLFVRVFIIITTIKIYYSKSYTKLIINTT